MPKPVRIIIAGCGSRGTGYARFAEENPDRVQIVGVADPIDFKRNRLGDIHHIPEENRFRTWQEMAARGKFADAVLICTQDEMHEEPAIAFAGLGYNIMLEKPMAPTPEACKRIVAAVKKAGVLFAVCHVLRYTDYTAAIRKLIRENAVGEIVSIQHLEPVGYWHQAHAFVRGNWRNTAESSCMLLAKCCHDLDWLRFIMNKPCKAIHSFGTLKHFRKEEKPDGAASRCTECPAAVEKNCPYSALKIYIRDRVSKGMTGWPSNVLVEPVTEETILKALKEGPYGRCVYECDNDVVDNQVVNMLFEGGATCSMTMTAFAPHTGRLTRIFGTRGYLDTDSKIIRVHDFLTDSDTEYDSGKMNDGGILSGHGGGDLGLMESFVSALETGDSSRILSGPDDTLESHLMVFSAERSRLSGTVEKL